MSAPSTTVYEGDDVQQKLSAAQELMEKTCNSKQPSDPMYQPQWEMAGAHGMFFRCLRHIYTVRRSSFPMFRDTDSKVCGILSNSWRLPLLPKTI